MDLPLEQIRSWLGETNPEATRALLVRHRERLVQRMAELTVALESLERMIGMPASSRYTIGVKDVAEQTVISLIVEVDSDNEARALGVAFFDLYRHLFEANIQSSVDPPFCIFHDLESAEDRLQVEVCIPISSPAATQGRFIVRETPAIRAVFTLHAGPYEGLAAADRAVAEWLEQHHYEPIGPQRVAYLVGPAQIKNPSELRTEILWPIATLKESG
jgi:effector-binding domain-containing protein